MKRTFSTMIMVGLTAYSVCAQTLNVVTGDITYAFPAAQTGNMTYQGSETLTVVGKTFSVADITRMYVDDSSVTDNTVSVNYSSTTATVTVAGNVAQYVTPTVTGAHVSIVQSAEVSDDVCGEITYTLAGSSTDGEFSMEGSYKASLELNGLTLTNPSGAPLNIQNGKRIDLSVKKGTENTLTDAASGDWKGCIVCKGHLELKGKGTLNVYGNTAHAIYAKEYVEMKNCTVNVLSAVKDGINCNQYFLMESGSLTVSGVADDGVQVSYKDDTDREAEDTGSLTIAGGTVNIAVTGTATKGLKAEGDLTVTDGTVTITTSGGGTWDTDDQKTKAASCISADGNIKIDGGTLTLTSSGSGSKGINGDGTLTINGGSVTVSTTGGMYAYVNGTEYNNYTGNTDSLDSDYKSSPKGMKIDGNVEINGGTINVTTTGNGAEGIESKAVLTINDGTIKAFGTTSPECGIDANEEDGYSVIFTGGTLLAVGGGNSVPSTSESTQPYVTTTMSVSANSEIAIKNGSTTLATFTVPSNYSSGNNGGGGNSGPGGRSGFGGNNGPGGPGGGGGGWGGSGSSILISCPSLTSGSSYTVTSGSSSATATAVVKSSSGGRF